MILFFFKEWHEIKYRDIILLRNREACDMKRTRPAVAPAGDGE